MDTENSSPSRRRGRGRMSFPVTVSQLPVARCQICGRRLAYRKGEVNEVLTAHYRREHTDLFVTPDDEPGEDE